MFAAAMERAEDELLAVGDGTTTLAVVSALALRGAGGTVRPLRRGTDAWTEAAGIDATAVDGGRVTSVATLRIESLHNPWPIVCATASFGAVADLLARLHGGSSAAAVAKDFALALAQANEPSGWGDDVPWGLICSGSGKVGSGVTLPAPREGFVASTLEPARGGGLLGLVRGVAGILSGGVSEERTELDLSGDGTVSLDGWLLKGLDRVRVTRGPAVNVVG